MKSLYSDDVVQLMCDFFTRLPERARRCYAGLESLKLGHGGITYISEIFQIDRKTVRRGRNELMGLFEPVPGSRQRKAGGGRKKKLQ
jgi:hypothetical protein